MGSDLRFSTSDKLIRRFITEYYRPMIKKIINREMLNLPNGEVLLLRSIQIVVESTKRLFFDDLSYIFKLNKLQPISENLDSMYSELFEEERDQAIYLIEKK